MKTSQSNAQAFGSASKELNDLVKQYEEVIAA